MKFIHFTDIHLKADGTNTILERKEQILSACHSIIRDTEEVILLFSGDIAYSGKKEEYALAKELIDYLKDNISCNCHVVIVPGNHDCDYSSSGIVRERLLSTLSTETDCDLALVPSMTAVQSNFLEFVRNYHQFDLSKIYNPIDFTVNNTRLHFTLINSAWMSSIHEKPGQLFIPACDYPYTDPSTCDLAITVMHHPLNWMHPDNYTTLLSTVRQDTDVLFIGHDHLHTHELTIDDNSNVFMLKGQELQSSTDKYSSGFAIYDLSSTGATVDIFNWKDKDKAYTRVTKNKVFSVIKPHNYPVLTLDSHFLSMLREPGVDVRHPRKEDLHLDDIFIYPSAEEVDMCDTSHKKLYTLSPMELLNNQFSVISGESMTGKTALLHMLFMRYYNEGKYCILIKGAEHRCSCEEDLFKIIDTAIINQYSTEQITVYYNTPINDRVVIIDDFDTLVSSTESKKQTMLSLHKLFGSSIIISNDITAPVFIPKSINKEAVTCKQYKLLPLGNQKRKEFIENWYNIGNTYTEDSDNLEELITTSYKTVTNTLGKYNGIIPATSLHMLSLLQGLEVSNKDKYKQSQYGFLYESLVNRSLLTSAHKYTSSAEMNVDVNIKCLLAYRMLENKQDTFHYSLFEQVVNQFAEDKLIEVYSKDVYTRMCTSKIIVGTPGDDYTFRFKYPYIQYYFTGKYIAFNLNNSDIINKIEYMCQHLYIEKYSNILIFVCHFADNEKVINIALRQAKSLYSDISPFSFKDVKKYYHDIQDRIALYNKSVYVGTNDDVNRHVTEKLSKQDSYGIHDGTVNDSSNYDNNVSMVVLATRTIDVLGQILCNYPGTLDGETKQCIIREIHDLGMRLFAYVMRDLSNLEQQFYEDIVNHITITQGGNSSITLVHKALQFLKMMSTDILQSILMHIANSLNDKALERAVTTVATSMTDMTYNLILTDLQLNMYHSANYDSVIKLYKEYTKSNPLAAHILRKTVLRFLIYNKCSSKQRKQLCAAFNATEQKVITEYYKYN